MSALSDLNEWVVMNVGSAAANDLWEIVGRLMADADAAIAAEREACAKIADETGLQEDWTAARIASAIRARSTET